VTPNSVQSDPDDTVTQSGLAPLEIANPTVVPPTEWAAATTVGLIRQVNEDRWINIGCSAFAVADGMGGHVGGAIAATAAVTSFVSIAGADVSLEQGDQVFRRINESVRRALSDASMDGGGSTLSAVILNSNVVSVVNVGDSRVLRLRSGSLDQLTTDHTVDAEMRASGMSPPASERLRNSLTSFLGIAPDLFRVDIAAHDVRRGDSYVICSDGVHGQVSVEDMSSLLDRRLSVRESAEALVDAADQAGGRDNATAIVLRF